MAQHCGITQGSRAHDLTRLGRVQLGQGGGTLHRPPAGKK